MTRAFAELACLGAAIALLTTSVQCATAVIEAEAPPPAEANDASTSPTPATFETNAPAIRPCMRSDVVWLGRRPHPIPLECRAYDEFIDAPRPQP